MPSPPHTRTHTHRIEIEREKFTIAWIKCSCLPVVCHYEYHSQLASGSHRVNTHNLWVMLLDLAPRRGGIFGMWDVWLGLGGSGNYAHRFIKLFLSSKRSSCKNTYTNTHPQGTKYNARILQTYSYHEIRMLENNKKIEVANKLSSRQHYIYSCVQAQNSSQTAYTI